MLSIVVPTRDKASRLRLCLETLREALAGVGFRWSLVVVDDGSRDATPELLAEMSARFGPAFSSLSSAAPVGRSRARNAGAEAASGRRLLFLDDDILVDAAALARHWAAGAGSARPVVARATILNLPWIRHFADPARPGPEIPARLAAQAVALSGGRLTEELRLNARRTPFESDLHRLLEVRHEASVGRWPAVTGGNLSVEREFFLSLGGFDPAMGVRWGLEDLELGFRAEAAGAYVLHLSEVTVYHLDHPVEGRELDHRESLRYFAAKHGSELGRRLADYFAGVGSLERVVAS